MVDKDYYALLGLADTATAEEVKSAFKKMARKYHPDVNKDAGAEEKFKDINEAYQILSNEDSKSHYDQQKKYGKDFKGYSTTSRQSSYETSAEDWLKELLKEQVFNSNPNKYQTYQRKTEKAVNLDINTTLQLSFLEAALGCTKMIKFSHKKECNTCKGIGYSGEKGVCKKCNGRKVTPQNQNIGGMNVNQMMRCPICTGTGIGHTQECKDCTGTGGISTQESLEAKIPPGVDTGSKMRFAGYGNTVLGSKGNLYLNIQVTEDHPRFKRDGLDIYTKENIKLIDLLLGSTIKVETIHGIVEVSIPEGSKPNSKLRLFNQGIDGHNHYIELNLVLPKQLTPEQKELIKQLDI